MTYLFGSERVNSHSVTALVYLFFFLNNNNNNKIFIS